MDYTKNTFAELKQLLKERSLYTTGKKADLIQRLEENDQHIKDEAGRFKVFVKTLVGSWYTIYLESSSATILELKEKINETLGCPPDKQILYLLCRDPPTFGDIMYPDGTVAKKIGGDDETLLSCGIHKESMLYLQIRLR